jgi:hypothetical protein
LGFAFALVAAGLRVAFVLRVTEEREVILLETCVQKSRAKKAGGTARLRGISSLKRALIGIGDSAPIRDK